MFKNMTIYRLKGFEVSADEVNAALHVNRFKPCGPLDMESTGWAAPSDAADLVHVCEGQILLALTTEKKILPAAVVKRVARERAKEIEEQQGFMPGRKQMRELREAVTDELLPRAMSTISTVRVWIDRENGWLVIDTASPSRADHVLKMLLKSIDNLPIESLRTMSSPIAAMTDWLGADEAPGEFMIDRDAILRTTGEGRGTIKLTNLTLEADDIGRHIAAGKQCTQLAMTWNDRISFVLTENMTIKRITPLDTYKETSGEDIQNADERFDADFLLMTGALNKMLGALVDALGGEFKQF